MIGKMGENDSGIIWDRLIVQITRLRLDDGESPDELRGLPRLTLTNTDSVR